MTSPPWLAQEKNLELLEDAIGLDLQLEAQEKNVGPFRADILCKDTISGTWVLIENQLERTDHGHLGQLLTYAAGLNAVSVVWIAQHFTEEHRAALDWLNKVTEQDINFFGLEIELWRIGQSDPAPKFNVVSKPNDWTRSVSDTAKRAASGSVSETALQWQEYWQQLSDLLHERNSFIKGGKGLPQNWADFAVGRTSFRLSASGNSRDKRIGVGLVISGPDGKAHYFLLKRQQAEIKASSKVIMLHLQDDRGSPADTGSDPATLRPHSFSAFRGASSAPRHVLRCPSAHRPVSVQKMPAYLAITSLYKPS